MAVASIMRVFRACPFPTVGASAACRGSKFHSLLKARIPWSQGKMQGILRNQPFFAKICLESISEFRCLRMNSLRRQSREFFRSICKVCWKAFRLRTMIRRSGWTARRFRLWRAEIRVLTATQRGLAFFDLALAEADERPDDEIGQTAQPDEIGRAPAPRSRRLPSGPLSRRSPSRNCFQRSGAIGSLVLAVLIAAISRSAPGAARTACLGIAAGIFQGPAYRSPQTLAQTGRQSHPRPARAGQSAARGAGISHQQRERLPWPTEGMALALPRRRHQEPLELPELAQNDGGPRRSRHRGSLDHGRRRNRAISTYYANITYKQAIAYPVAIILPSRRNRQREGA